MHSTLFKYVFQHTRMANEYYIFSDSCHVFTKPRQMAALCVLMYVDGSDSTTVLSCLLPHHRWAAVVSYRWAKASAYMPSPTDSVPPIFVQPISSPLDWHPLSSFEISCRMVSHGDTRGPSFLSSARRLMCPAQDHFIFSQSLRL